MAVSLTSLNDDLISQLALESFVATLQPMSAFSTSYSADAARRGTTIEVPLVQNITATSAYPAYESSDTGSAIARQIVLHDYYKATIGVTDQQFHGSSFVDVEKFAYQQGYAVASAVQNDFFSLMTSSNFSTSVTITSGAFGLSDALNVRLALSRNHAPMADKCIVLAPQPYNGILGALSSALVYGNPNPIQEGKDFSTYGMKVLEAQNLPDNGIGLVGFGAHPNAIAVAVRPLIPQDNSYYIESRVIEDENSGLALTYRRHYAPSNGTHWVTIECLYGYTAGVTGALCLIKTT